MDRESMPAKNQSYTANTSFAKNPEFSKSAAMTSRVEMSFVVTLVGCIWGNLRMFI